MSLCNTLSEKHSSTQAQPRLKTVGVSILPSTPCWCHKFLKNDKWPEYTSCAAQKPITSHKVDQKYALKFSKFASTIIFLTTLFLCFYVSWYYYKLISLSSTLCNFIRLEKLTNYTDISRIVTCFTLQIQGSHWPGKLHIEYSWNFMLDLEFLAW